MRTQSCGYVIEGYVFLEEGKTLKMLDKREFAWILSFAKNQQGFNSALK
jgi:hypothetical protein